MREEHTRDDEVVEKVEYLAGPADDAAALLVIHAHVINDRLSSEAIPPDKALAIAQFEAAQEAVQQAIVTGATYSRDELLQIAAAAAMEVN